MSVINQMLRDLDSRQASQQERAGLPPRLRSLPGQALTNAKGWRMLALGMLFGVLTAGLAVWWLAPQAIMPLLPAVTAAMPAATAPPVTAPPVAPPVAPPAPAAVLPEPTLAQQAAEETLRPPIDQADMKLSILLSQDKSNPEPAPLADANLAARESPQTQAAQVEAAVEIKPAPKPAPTLDTKPDTKPDKKPVEVRPPAPMPPVPSVPPAPASPMAKSPTPESAIETQIDKRTKGDQVHGMAETEYRKGMQAVKRGENSVALPALQRSLELDPGFAKARQALLSVLVGARQWTDAQQVAQNGLALDPAQSGWAMIVARLQFEQSNTAAAIETLERYAVHAANDADYHGFFAYLLQKQQRPGEAAQHFQIAVGLRPGEGRWWFGLGLSQETAGHAKEAHEAYAKAREIGNLPTDMAAVVAQKLR